MKIQKVTDPAFRKYGKVLEGYNFSALLKEMKHTPVPEDVVYVPSVEELEALEVEKDLRNRAFGGLPIEIGYCNGSQQETERCRIPPQFRDQRSSDRSGTAHRTSAGY